MSSGLLLCLLFLSPAFTMTEPTGIAAGSGVGESTRGARNQAPPPGDPVSLGVPLPDDEEDDDDGHALGARITAVRTGHSAAEVVLRDRHASTPPSLPRRAPRSPPRPA